MFESRETNESVLVVEDPKSERYKTAPYDLLQMVNGRGAQRAMRWTRLRLVTTESIQIVPNG